MKRLNAIAAAVLWAGSLAANAYPTYLRCDFKDHKGTIPSKEAIDLTLNEAKRTVETRALASTVTRTTSISDLTQLNSRL